MKSINKLSVWRGLHGWRSLSRGATLFWEHNRTKGDGEHLIHIFTYKLSWGYQGRASLPRVLGIKGLMQNTCRGCPIPDVSLEITRIYRRRPSSSPSFTELSTTALLSFLSPRNHCPKWHSWFPWRCWRSSSSKIFCTRHADYVGDSCWPHLKEKRNED